MSRGQQGQVFDQSKAQNAQAFGNAEDSYNLAQTDIGNYQQQLGRYANENPFTENGQFANDQNRVLANTADASAQAAGARLQSQAARTGQNPAGSIAATEAMQQENERNLSGQEAQANEQRIAGLADYNKGVLGATAVPVSMETALSGQQGNLATGALDAEEKAAQTPSFLESLEGQLAQAGSSFVGGLGAGIGKNM